MLELHESSPLSCGQSFSPASAEPVARSLLSFIPSGYYLALSEGLSVQAIRAEDGECGRSLYLFPSSFARGPVALGTPRALVSMQLC